MDEDGERKSMEKGKNCEERGRGMKKRRKKEGKGK